MTRCFRFDDQPAVRGPFTGSNVAAETDGAYDADLLAPERVQASFSYLRTDAARFSMLGESLREALNSSLSEKVDQEGIAGTNGLLAGANLANHAAGGTTTFAQYVSRFAYGRVDGRFAATTRDLKALVGSSIFAHMGTVYKSTETDVSAVDRLMAVVGMDNIRVSAHVPSVVNKKQNAVVRLGMRRDTHKATLTHSHKRAFRWRLRCSRPPGAMTSRCRTSRRTDAPATW